MSVFSKKYVFLIVAGSVAALSVIINVTIMRAWKTSIVEEPLQHYDYIIIGGGTAGCVLTRRIAEKCSCSVLLIEAGSTAPWASSIPIAAPALQLSATDWAYKTVPQKKSHWAMDDRRSFWPRGKALGGSSVINYMLHMWGSNHEFDTSFSQSIDDNWNFKSVLPYYQKLEIFRKASEKPVSSIRGTEGLLPAEEFDGSESELTKAFLDGASTLGLELGDLNGEIKNGVMLSQSNVREGKRISMFDAYLKPVLQKYNISLMINTVVRKIIFEDKTAVGVKVKNLFTKKFYTILCRKELILSAGVIGSPQLLMLSGIGPAAHLKDMRIPVIADLPGVGRNLQDHLTVPMYFHLDAPVSVTTAKAKSLWEVWDYFYNGRGLLSSTGAHAMARTPLPGTNTSRPEALILLLSVGTIDETIYRKISNMGEKAFAQTFPGSQNATKEGFLLLPSCLFPKSKGKILLASIDPLRPPAIDPQYLEDEEDITCLIKAIRLAASIGTTQPLTALGSQLHLPAYDRCMKYQQSLNNDDYLECWIRTSAVSEYHTIGTCSMGTYQDSLAVLDSEFRVRNLKNLRVIDASAMPHHVAGTPHASIVMMAERASEWILRNFSISNIDDYNNAVRNT